MAKLKFNKKKHQYTFDNKKLISVSQLIHKFTNEFDEKKMSKVISNLIQKEFIRVDGMFLTDLTDESIKEIMPKFYKLYSKNWEYMLAKLLHERKDKTRFVNATMVKKAWKQKALDSQKHGTEVHHALEKYIEDRTTPNLFAYDKSYAKTQFGIEFLNTLPEEYELFTELKMFSAEMGIAGTCDLHVDRKDGYIDVYDWKTNEEIKRESYKGQKMKAPLDHIPDCNFYHYALQQSFYWLLDENEARFKVNSINLVHLREDGYEIIPLPFLKDECLMMIEAVK